jgi:hypothetical protein
VLPIILVLVLVRGLNRLLERGIRREHKVVLLPVEVSREGFMRSIGARTRRQKVFLINIRWSGLIVCVCEINIRGTDDSRS